MFSFFWVGAQNTNPFDLFDRDSMSEEVDTIVQDTFQFVILDSVSQNQTSIDTLVERIVGIDTARVALLPPSVVNPFNLVEEDSLRDTSTPRKEVAASIVVDTLVSGGEEVKKPDEVIKPKESLVSQELPEKSSKNLITFIIALLSALLLSIVLNGNRNILTEMLKSLRNLNFMKLFQKEEKNGNSPSFYLFYTIYIFNMGVFIRFVAVEFQVPLFGYNIILIVLTVAIFVFIRHFSLATISYLRKRLPDAISYSFIISIVNSLLGLFLIPVNLLIAFGPSGIALKTIYVGFGLVALAFLIKWFRGLINSLRIVLGDSFHFLLYLCTCEIVPILMCVAYVRNLIN